MSGPGPSVSILPTLDAKYTFDVVVEEEQNMLQRLSYGQKRLDFLAYLLKCSTEIEAIVSYHLDLSETGCCSLAPLDDWLHGSFNICVPVDVKILKKRIEKRVMIRFPLPFKIGEENFPGNAEEKLRCEAATYIWIQETCPDIPVPQLLGFSSVAIDASHHWEFFLCRMHLARIGSFTLDNTGVLSLTNRPLTLALQRLENGGIPANIARKNTYTAVEPYILDLLACHESRLRCQPNAINDEADCRAQMAALTGMRAVLPHFIDRELRHGPFLFTLTDIHQSNVFVDEEWHVKYVIDLEWACSLLIQMQKPPYWLTSQLVDELTGENLSAYDKIREEFMEAFEYEEKLQSERMPHRGTNKLSRTRTMGSAWKAGSFFYSHALHSPEGFFNLWIENIRPRFSNMNGRAGDSSRFLAPYGCVEAESMVAIKMRNREEYVERLRTMYAAAAQV